MTGMVILFVLGLVLFIFSTPLLGFVGALVGASVGDRFNDFTALGAIVGYILGVLLSATGLVIVIIQAINIITYLTGK